MEWFKTDSFEVIKKSFYISQKTVREEYLTTIIKGYEIKLNGVLYKIEMQYVFDIFGGLMNSKFNIDNENKMLRDTFNVVFEICKFFYPHFYTPLLKLAWIILITIFLFKFIK